MGQVFEGRGTPVEPLWNPCGTRGGTDPGGARGMTRGVRTIPRGVGTMAPGVTRGVRTIPRGVGTMVPGGYPGGADHFPGPPDH